MTNPRLLDLFCGAGGCSAGYVAAGFDVVGVDIAPQPHYPYRFVQCDALEYVAQHGKEYDAIHASPPCQAYSVASLKSRKQGKVYPDMVAATRQALQATGRLWVIENVPQAPISGITLCGTMFGLQVFRHRVFESNCYLLEPQHTPHKGKIGDGFVCVAGRTGNFYAYGKKVYKGSTMEWKAAMKIDWMTAKELTQAIPPAYTAFIGRQLRNYV